MNAVAICRGSMSAMGTKRTPPRNPSGQEKCRARTQGPALTKPCQEIGRHGKKPHIYGSVSELTAAQNRKRVNKNSYRCGPEGCKNRGRSHPQGSAAPISSRPQLSPRSGPTFLQWIVTPAGHKSGWRS